MAEIKFNTLYDQMSGANQDFYDDTFTKYYNPDQAWTDQQNALTMKTLPDQSSPDFNAMRTAYDQGAKSKTLNNSFWSNLNPFGTAADAAMPTAEERAAIERRSADIERRTGVLPGGRELPLQVRNPQEYYMQNRPYEYDSRYKGPIGATGRRPDDGGFIEYQEPFEHPYGIVGRRYSPEYLQQDAANKGWFTRGFEFDEGLQQALINRNRKNLYGDEGIAAVDIQETMGPEEQIMTRPNFGRIDPLTTNQKPGLFEGIGQKLGMTQVSPEDRAANEQFMQDQGIRRDPQTGRMIGGDFEGMNPAGKSGWGSANFGEMSQNWMDKYGDVEYSRTVIGDMKRKKQARMKKRAAEYQAKLQQQAIQEKTRQDALRGAGAYSSQVQMDPGGGGTWHGQTAAKEAAGQQVAGPGFGKGAYFYRGGRVGYNTGGRVGILSIF